MTFAEYSMLLGGLVALLAARPIARARQAALKQDDADMNTSVVVLRVLGAVLIVIWIVGRLTP